MGTTAASRKRVATTTVCFEPLTSSETVLALRNLAIPLNTNKNTSWATNAWIEWTEYVLQQGVDPEDAPSALINQMTKEEPNRWLLHFVMGARRQDGKPYPRIHSINCAAVLTHPNYSARMEHLYKCRVHRLSENVECTNEEMEE